MKTIDAVITKDNEKEAIREAARMLKNNFPVKQVILFGSKARGDDDEESDIDLFLLTSRPMDWKERESMLDELFDIEMKYDVIISLIDATEPEWRDGVFSIMPIHEVISKEGLEVS